MPSRFALLSLALIGFGCEQGGEDPPDPVSYPVVGTQQSRCYGTDGTVVSCTSTDEPALFGQDGSYPGRSAEYTPNGDGTVTDQVTGLMWQRAPAITPFADAEATCAGASTGDHDDWRVPTIKELYSLIDFRGQTGTITDPAMRETPDDAIPYMDTDAFTFSYGNEVDLGNGGPTGGRFIDAQYLTSTEYVSTVMDGMPCFFGVNFADGRIKCYPTASGRSWFLLCVRGGDGYGLNRFHDAGDGAVEDRATGLTWMRQDSGHLEGGASGDGTMDWPAALAWCEQLEAASHTDWRLPDAKELQSLVDYSRSPDTTGSAALDPLFEATGITNEGGDADFGWYWSSTTHLDGKIMGADAAYVAFGRALGFFHEDYVDVHGAGAQRGDPKIDDGSDLGIGCGMGPQGDCRRILNLVRCVRGGPH